MHLLDRQRHRTANKNFGRGLVVIYRDDLTVLDKLPTKTSFELQLVRVGPTSLTVSLSSTSTIYLLLMWVSSSMKWLMCLLLSCPVVAIICCCAETQLLVGDWPGLRERLSTTFVEFRLTQHITLPTLGDRLLDVIVSDDAIPVRNVLVSDSTGISDYRLITTIVQRPLQIE